jgi:hypothetical protein
VLQKIPRPLRFALAFAGVNFAMYLLFRVGFYFAFHGLAPDLSAHDSMKSWRLGLKFDLRLALVLQLPLVLATFAPAFDPVRSPRARRLLLAYAVSTGGLVSLLYMIDFGHFAWLHERLNASAIDYILSPGIALQTIWESYPIVWAMLGWAAFVAAYGWVVDRVAIGALRGPETPLPRGKAIAVYAGAALLYASAVYGKISMYPLRWSDALYSTDNFASALALNPIL